jgi:hypothetical protein
MQIARKFKGKEQLKVAKYCPFDFFESEGRKDTLLQSLQNLLAD